MQQILNSIWFSNRDGIIGIVMVNDEYDGIQYFIGSASGEDQTADEAYIAAWGAKFPIKAGNTLFGS